MSILKIIPFYPGSIWIKRIGHICLIFTIGFNLFLDRIQNKCLRIIDENMVRISQSVENINLKQVEMRLDIPEANFTGQIPQLSIQEIEVNRFIDFLLRCISRVSNLPEVSELNKEIRKLKEIILNIEDKLKEFEDKILVTKENYLHLVDKIEKVNKDANEVNKEAKAINLNAMLIQKIVKDIIVFIGWTSFLMWFPIAISALWLKFDLKYGSAKYFVKFFLILSIPINIYVYVKLNQHFNYSQKSVIEFIQIQEKNLDGK